MVAQRLARLLGLNANLPGKIADGHGVAVPAWRFGRGSSDACVRVHVLPIGTPARPVPMYRGFLASTALGHGRCVTG
jgi:hypothetical protein